MNQLFLHARTRTDAARQPSDDSTSSGSPSRPAPRRRAPRIVGALLVAGLAGTGLGAAGLSAPLGGPDAGSTVLADGATVDLSRSAADVGEALPPERERDQPSRSEIRDAGGIDEFGAQRRQSLAVQAQGAESAERDQQVADAEAVRLAALAEAEAQAQRVAAVDAALADPRSAGRALAAERGWGGEQFQCLDSLWTKESDWTPTADNPTSDAYGIPQSLPGEKMAADGADWATNPLTQISWGLTYIRDVYGSPCGAWAHSRATDWY